MDTNLILYWVFLQFAIFLYSSYTVHSQPFDYPIANLSTSWVNSVSANHSVSFSDGSTVRAILLRGSFGPRFACGFFCNGTCDVYLFAIFIVQTNSASGITSPSIGFPPVVWSANPNNPVRINATLALGSDGDLVLRDSDGTVAWSTGTANKSVAGLNLTDAGNLILFDKNNLMVWNSFDYPTDSLVPGQKFVPGQKLTASVSTTNWTQGGLFSLSVTNNGFFAYVESNPPQFYYRSTFTDTNRLSYVVLLNGSLAFFTLSPGSVNPERTIPVPVSSSAQYMKFGPDGHLRVYEWGGGWKIVSDLFTGYYGLCNYPMACGKYGICSNQQCSCPGTSYFSQIDNRQPDLGCVENTPLSCESEKQGFLELEDITYFTFNSNPVFDLNSTDMDSCKQACLKNCSCKAALFMYFSDASKGNCYLPSEIFSLMNNDPDMTHYNSSAFVKVQNTQTSVAPTPANDPRPVPLEKTKQRVGIILGSSLGAFFGLFFIIGFFFFLARKKTSADSEEEEYLDQVPGMPTRFSYEDLKSATNDFDRKLGEGGFGSVFEGTLSNGTIVAVKRLDGLGQIKKSFLAEVESIGSIHHVNLARLIGFCAEKSHRLLVYEFMRNGSLDKWIFHKDEDSFLTWKQRKQIILDIAKGLAYLHEDCRQKIIHLDIKPQNILLDENFNAKVSDFGLSKLIDRDQSQVMTTMRGTPGYLAPEWLSSVITEKVDVYSFGVVVLEILCGRKNFDRSLPENDMHLLTVFKRKAEEERLLDIVDNSSADLRMYGAEVVQLMRVAAWCLQSDFGKRPSMSVVVKVLEGFMDVEDNLDYNFSYPPVPKTSSETKRKEVRFSESTALLPSVLSGPR